MMDALADPNKCCTSVFGDTIPLKSYVEAALKAAKPNSAAFVEQATIGVPEKLQPDGSGPRDLLNAVGS
jgi:hypothetical protein